MNKDAMVIEKLNAVMQEFTKLENDSSTDPDKKKLEKFSLLVKLFQDIEKLSGYDNAFFRQHIVEGIKVADSILSSSSPAH